MPLETARASALRQSSSKSWGRLEETKGSSAPLDTSSRLVTYQMARSLAEPMVSAILRLFGGKSSSSRSSALPPIKVRGVFRSWVRAAISDSRSCCAVHWADRERDNSCRMLSMACKAWSNSRIPAWGRGKSSSRAPIFLLTWLNSFSFSLRRRPSHSVFSSRHRTQKIPRIAHHRYSKGGSERRSRGFTNSLL